jgi:hypothetical protein
MRLSLYVKIFLLAGAAAIFSGCSTTTLLTSWSDSKAQSYTLKKPLVVAIVKTPLIRKKLEDEFVMSFQKIGINAVSSYTAFPEMSDLAPDAVKGKLPYLGRDSILVIRLIDVKQETVHVPARTDVYGGGFGGPAYYGGYGGPAHYGSYGGYYSNSVSIVSSPAYNYVEKYYVAETTIFDAVEGKLVWTGATETEDTKSIDAAVTDFTNVLMKDIRAKAIF